MAGFFKGLMDSLKLSDDEEAFEEYERSEQEQNKSKKAVGSGLNEARISDRFADRSRSGLTDTRTSGSLKNDTFQSKKVHTTSNYSSSTYIEKGNGGKNLRMERPEGNKVVPIKTTRAGLEVCVMKPRTFEESQDICDVLLSDCCAIVNLEDNDISVSRRVMDFIYGVVYSINGKLIQISDLIFIVAPGNVDVSGDYNDILAQTGYEFPSLNK